MATFVFSVECFSLKFRKGASQFSGSVPEITRSNSSFRSDSFNRLRQASILALFIDPTLRHALPIASGISKAGCGQLSDSRVAVISSSPSGAPCVAAVPALFGDPKPIVVLQATSDGLS